jgi:hypothetical protein
MAILFAPVSKCFLSEWIYFLSAISPRFFLFSGADLTTLAPMKATFLLLLAGAVAACAADSITVEAGDFDRRETIVECELPVGVSGLVSKDQTLPVQHDGNGRARFIVRDLKRGESRTYSFAKVQGAWAAEAKAKTDSVTLSVFGKTAFVYRTEKTALPPNRPDLKLIFQRGGYIHPVLSPSGKQITDDYPSNHKHHHGLWFAWTHTEFEGRKPDFWNMGDNKGTVEFVALDTTWGGTVHSGFISRHRQVDLLAPTPKTALNETWNVKLFAVGQQARQPYFLFDLEVTDVCATDSPVKLPKYRYGGIGVRGNWAWNGAGKLNFINSEGTTDRSKGDNNETVGKWAHLGGMLDGGLTGIAILGHPANANAPQPQRIHPTEPFFNFAPQQAGDLEIAPGKPFVSRYRFVVADGAPDKAELDRLWNDYAFPPKVVVK